MPDEKGLESLFHSFTTTVTTYEHVAKTVEVCDKKRPQKRSKTFKFKHLKQYKTPKGGRTLLQIFFERSDLCNAALQHYVTRQT